MICSARIRRCLQGAKRRMQFLQQIFGDPAARYVSFFLAFLAVLIVVMLLWILIRKAMGERINFSDKPDRRGRAPRLGVTESFPIGPQGRRLVMVRRDNVEHLLMIGGPNDVVIETNVVRGERPIVARMGDRQSDAELLAPPEPPAPIAAPQPKIAVRSAPVAMEPLPAAPPMPKPAPAPVEMPIVRAKLPEPPKPPEPPKLPEPPKAVELPKAVDLPKAPEPLKMPEPPKPAPVDKAPERPVMPEAPARAPVEVATPPLPPAAATPAPRKSGSLTDRLMSGLRGKITGQSAPPAPAQPAVPKPATDERSFNALKQELEALDRMATTPPPAPKTRVEPKAPTAIPAPVVPAPPPAVEKPPAAPAPAEVAPPLTPKTAPAANAPRAPVRNPFDSLEEEMAKLLGRSGDGKT
jgi:flagellar protein FliO/FliZ